MHTANLRYTAHRHEGLTRNKARMEYGHSPDPFWWPRSYYQGGRRSGDTLLAPSELPQIEIQNLDQLEALADVVLEAYEASETEADFDTYLNSITEI